MNYEINFFDIKRETKLNKMRNQNVQKKSESPGIATYTICASRIIQARSCLTIIINHANFEQKTKKYLQYLKY